MTTGKFITFEGGEGGGKSTQSSLLTEAFNNAAIEAVKTREPGGTDGAEAIRELLVKGEVNKWDAVTETLLHLAARREHVSKLISPAMEKGKYVICDRFLDSTMSYQGYGHELGRNFVDKIQKIIIGNFKPDLTFILDIDPKDGIGRADSRGGKEDRYEKMGKDFHTRVRDGFREVAEDEYDRCILIDADGSIDKIHQQIIDAVNERFSLSLEPISN